MMPPECCLCNQKSRYQTDCQSLCFSGNEHDLQWLSRQTTKNDLSKQPNCDWFCKLHFHTAEAFVHTDLQSALRHIRTDECWHLSYIDLFDRDTPPSITKSGVGFETGFVELWDSILGTVEVTGVKYPLTYSLSFTDDRPDYEPLRWPINEVLKVKQFLSGRNDAPRLQEQIAISQAREMRHHGSEAPAQWMTSLCVQLDKQGEPELLKRSHE